MPVDIIGRFKKEKKFLYGGQLFMSEAYYFLEYEKLRRKNNSLEFENRRLKVMEEKCGLCIKHLYLSGMSRKEISKMLHWDVRSVSIILRQMRVKIRED